LLELSEGLFPQLKIKFLNPPDLKLNVPEFMSSGPLEKEELFWKNYQSPIEFKCYAFPYGDSSSII